MDDDEALLSFLGPQLSTQFERRMVVLAPDHNLAYDEAEWRDAIVVVEQGQIDLECADGRRYCFRRGAVLWLDRLPLRSLHNSGPESAVLVAVSRCAASQEC